MLEYSIPTYTTLSGSQALAATAAAADAALCTALCRGIVPPEEEDDEEACIAFPESSGGLGAGEE